MGILSGLRTSSPGHTGEVANALERVSKQLRAKQRESRRRQHEMARRCLALANEVARATQALAICHSKLEATRARGERAPPHHVSLVCHPYPVPLGAGTAVTLLALALCIALVAR